MLYSPLLFKQKQLGGLTFNSRFYLGTGIPLNEPQWFFPFAVDDKGEAVWMARNDTKLAHYLTKPNAALSSSPPNKSPA
ncbi:MAG: hypothetical protein U0X75_16685 [Acidobacteriota bacterium]